ncbi:hypothetical protein LINPERPRIM_LOCUS41388, partial [Linum perenne]
MKKMRERLRGKNERERKREVGGNRREREERLIFGYFFSLYMAYIRVFIFTKLPPSFLFTKM